MKALAALLLSLLLALSGCGGSGSPDPDVLLKQHDDTYRVVTIPWHGREVECIRMHASRGEATYGGLSCDFGTP